MASANQTPGGYKFAPLVIPYCISWSLSLEYFRHFFHVLPRNAHKKNAGGVGPMRDLDQGLGRTARDNVNGGRVEAGAGRRPGLGDDQPGGRPTGGQDHRLRKIQVN